MNEHNELLERLDHRARTAPKGHPVIPDTPEFEEAAAVIRAQAKEISELKQLSANRLAVVEEIKRYAERSDKRWKGMGKYIGELVVELDAAREDEREACAKIAEDAVGHAPYKGYVPDNMELARIGRSQYIAAEIRKRTNEGG